MTPDLLEMYITMVRIRQFEEMTAELFDANEIKGTVHSCVGQEAVAVGVAAALRDDDYIAGHHRSHGHVIAKGATMDRMMAELMGRRSGYCAGLGGSMHIADLSLGIVGCNGIVGASPGLAAGAALRERLQGSGRVAVAFFGDGAVNEGVVYEVMNIAAVWKLPVIFVCENNAFALSTEWPESRVKEDIAIRAVALGMPGDVVDGNDVLQVREAAKTRIDAAREGNGPAFIEAKTYRRGMHSMRANLPDARDPETEHEWASKDPILRAEVRLIEAGTLTEEIKEKIWNAAQDEVAEAIAYARQDETASEADLLPFTTTAHDVSYAEPPRGSRRLSFMAAIVEAQSQELERDERVILLGEDIRMGGIFRATVGLVDMFGPERIRNCPISEAGYTSIAVGAALTGLRPIVEIQIFDFVTLAMDALVNQAAKMRFMMGGNATVPMVVRGPSGGGFRVAAQHSQSLEAWFAHVPGLITCAPSNAFDAKGLLTAAIRDDNPVVFLEAKSLLAEESEVPEEPYAIPLGKAAVVRPGADVTVVATQALVGQAMRAAAIIEQEGVSVEVIDPRTIYPLDTETILTSVSKTGRAVIAHEAGKFGGIGGEIAAVIAEEGFENLSAPIARVGMGRHPVPYEDKLERMTLPNRNHVLDAIRRVLAYGSP